MCPIHSVDIDSSGQIVFPPAEGGSLRPIGGEILLWVAVL
jgi:hypothetical protein